MINPLTELATALFSNKYEINDDYKKALNYIEQGENIFITGSGGNGKSTFIEVLTEILDNKVLLTPTGIAAYTIGGQTIHSFFRFPITTLSTVDIPYYKEDVAEMFQNIEYIIIDEISMVRSDVFSLINCTLQEVRKNYEPFGGIQIILLGDLFQLGAIVSDRESKQYLEEVFNGKYFFNTYDFKEGDFKPVVFNKTYRQEDKDFIDILQRLRTGKQDENTFKYLNSIVSPIEEYEERIKSEEYVYLCNTNKLKDEINDFRLAKINEPLFTYTPEISGNGNLKNTPLEPILNLKVGTQIMMVNNDSDRRWVNGSIGKVTFLNRSSIKVNIKGREYAVEPKEWGNIRYTYDAKTKKISKNKIGTVTQFPIIRSWSLSIHKSQSQTFEKVYFDPSRIFTSGQLYTALSRCKSPNTLGLKKRIMTKDIRVDKEALKFYDEFFGELES